MEYVPIDIQTQFKEFKLHDDSTPEPVFAPKEPEELSEEVRQTFVNCFGTIIFDPTKNISKLLASYRHETNKV